jgi:peptide/nickel transport system substrate-binding protein
MSVKLAAIGAHRLEAANRSKIRISSQTYKGTPEIHSDCKSWILAAAVLAFSTFATLPSYAQNRTGTITVGLVEDIRGMDPRRERDGMSDPVHLHVVEGLVGFRDDLEVGPMLAESIATEADGTAYVFKLRDGVKFHNGEPLSSEDVKWSWDYLMAEDSIWRCRPVFSGEVGMRVVAVDTPDPKTVVFRLDAPNASFLYNLARPDCAGTPVFHRDSLKADGSWNKVIGTGPFELGERRVGEFAEIVRFPDYAARDDEPSGMIGRKEALVDKVRFTVVSDPAARVVGLRSGALDLAPVPDQSVDQIEAEDDLSIVSSETTVWYALLLNQNDPLLKDVRIRQAIAAAIDRDAVAQGVSFGRWPGTSTPMPRASRFFTEAQAGNRAADPERAKRLLAEAGYSGQPITMIANKGYDLMFNQAVIIQSMLQAVGINATIEVLEWGLQLERYTKGDYQAQSFGYSGRYEPMGAWERIIGPESRKVWKDEEAIALLQEGMETTDPEKIREISDRLYEKFIAEVPAVSLYHVNTSLGVNDRLQGLKPSPFESPRLWNVSIKE